ncbi:MAG: hypothetical protein H0M93_03010 [Methanophagales archaeon]|nr:hypothetical protein [Methanophagales archaeon]
MKRKVGEKGKDSKRSYILKVGTTVFIVAIAVTMLVVAPAMAEAEAVEVRVNAPEYVYAGASFVVTIDITDVTDLNSAQFCLLFDPGVITVREVKRGEINGEAFKFFEYRSIAEDTMRVIALMDFGKGVDGSGYLATIVFDAVGKEGEKSELSLSEGVLFNSTVENIPAEWIRSEIRIRIKEEKIGVCLNQEEAEVREEVLPGFPVITAWNPVEAVVKNIENESRTFNITVDHKVDISWQINGTEVQRNESTREAVFTKANAVPGTWNVSVIATNTTTELSDMQTWIWNVTPTAAVIPTPVPEPEAEIEEVLPAPEPAQIPVAEEPAPAPKLPGFQAVFAIGVIVAVAYILMKKIRR